MSPLIAAAVFVIGILGLYLLDFDWKAHTSKALLIPLAWLMINGSRPVSTWLQGGVAASSEQQYMDGSPLDAAVFGSLIIAGLIVLFSRRQKVLAILRANGPILLFFFYCAISAMWSDYPDVSFKRWIKACGDLVMPLVVLTEVDRSAAVKRFLAWTGFVLIPVSLLFIKYYPDLGRAYAAHWEGTQFYTGVTDNKNTLGMICLVFGLGAFWRISQIVSSREIFRRIRPLAAQIALLSIALWLLWLCNSMTSLSCFALAASLVAVTSFSAIRRRRWLVHLMVLGVISMSVFAVFFDSGGGLLSNLGRDPTLTGRTEIWSAVIALTANPLLGAGFESFWLGKRLEKLWSVYWWHPQEAHNGYLEVFLNLGWMGIVLLGLLIITGYRNILVMLRRDPEAGRLRLGYFVAAVIYSVTEAGFRMMHPLWLFLLLATIALPKSKAKVPKVTVRREVKSAESWTNAAAVLAEAENKTRL